MPVVHRLPGSDHVLEVLLAFKPSGRYAAFSGQGRGLPGDEWQRIVYLLDSIGSYFLPVRFVCLGQHDEAIQFSDGLLEFPCS